MMIIKKMITKVVNLILKKIKIFIWYYFIIYFFNLINTKENKEEDNKEEEEDNKEEEDNINTNIPFTFECPSNYNQFYQIIKNRNKEEITIIINRIRTCNHPSLKPGNKDKLQVFYFILLFYFILSLLFFFLFF
jgi:hypothetical protein